MKLDQLITLQWPWSAIVEGIVNRYSILYFVLAQEIVTVTPTFSNHHTEQSAVIDIMAFCQQNYYDSLKAQMVVSIFYHQSIVN